MRGGVLFVFTGATAGDLHVFTRFQDTVFHGSYTDAHVARFGEIESRVVTRDSGGFSILRLLELSPD